MEKNGYFRKHSDWPKLEWRENGTPLVSEESEGPPDYSDALSPVWFPDLVSEGPTQFDREPTFLALLAYTRSHPRIVSHLFWGPDSGMFETQIGVLAGNLLDRYVHLTGRFEFDPDKFLPEYLLMEAGLLSENLSVALLVPILCLGFEADRVHIDEEIDVRRLGDRIQIARAPSLRNASGSDPSIQMAATHSLVLANYSFANNGQFDLWRALGSRDSYPLLLIDTVFTSLRLAVNGLTGYAQLLALPVGWASSFKADLLPLHTVQIRRYPPSL